MRDSEGDMRRVAYLGFLILIAVVGTSIVLSQKATPRSAGSDGEPKITVVSSTPFLPSDRGKAKGSAPNFQLSGGDLRASVLAQPLPQVWLEFSANGSLSAPESRNAEAVRIDLPDEARISLMSCWQAYLEYYFNTKVENEKNFQTLVHLDVAMVATAARTAASLEELPIGAPNGRRRISHDEAWEIVSFLGRSAEGVVEQAKQYKSRPQLSWQCCEN
jgi:hypothetical protein